MVDFKEGNLTAQTNASFTFQINHKDFPIFTIHFTCHGLPYETLSAHTQGLIENAKTIVIEPIPWEEEPKGLKPRLDEVVKTHLLDPDAHRKMKEDMSEQDYEKLKTLGREHDSRLFTNEYFAQFESFSPFAFFFFLHRKLASQEAKDGMDWQIERLALDKGKIVTGLESLIEKLITLMPQAIQILKQSRKTSVVDDIRWHLFQLTEEKQSNDASDDPWTSSYKDSYKDGKFFHIAYLSDQANAKEDVDSVAARDKNWMPRIKEILMSPDDYPSPIVMNMGCGHHGILKLLEDDGFKVMIFNKNGEPFPFAYTQAFASYTQAVLEKGT